MAFPRKPKVKRAYKKRYTKKPMKSMSVKKMINNAIQKDKAKNIETKRTNIQYLNQDATMGQCSGNANGFYAGDITPQIASGSAMSERIGHEVVVTGCYITMQLRQMPSLVSPCELHCYLVQPKCVYNGSASDLVQSLWTINPYVVGGNIWDTSSEFNFDNLNQYKIVRRWKTKLSPDNFSGQQMPKVVKIGTKFTKQYKIQYNGASATALNMGRTYLVVFASAGNASIVTGSSLTNVPVTVANSGVFINYNCKWFYRDE